MIKKQLLAATCGILLAVGSAAGVAQIVVRVGPPAPIVETPPPPPHPGWVWVHGFHRWDGGRYVWVPGHYIEPRPGHFWVDGHWAHRPGGWVWIEGHWR